MSRSLLSYLCMWMYYDVPQSVIVLLHAIAGNDAIGFKPTHSLLPCDRRTHDGHFDGAHTCADGGVLRSRQLLNLEAVSRPQSLGHQLFQLYNVFYIPTFPLYLEKYCHLTNIIISAYPHLESKPQ